MAYNPASYEGARRGIESQYGTGSAQNAYGRFVSQTRGKRDQGDFTRNTKRQYPGQASSYNRRGFNEGGVSSGVQQDAMNRYAGDYTRGLGRMQQDLTSQMQGYDISDQQLDSWRQGQLADLELQRQNEISSAASNIEALRQFLGGL